MATFNTNEEETEPGKRGGGAFAVENIKSSEDLKVCKKKSQNDYSMISCVFSYVTTSKKKVMSSFDIVGRGDMFAAR